MNLYLLHLWPLLLVPLLGVFFYLSRRSLAEGKRGRAAASFGLRSGVVLLLLLAVAELHTARRSDELAVVFVLDRSRSVPGAIRERAVQNTQLAVSGMGEGNLAGMVVFGTTASIEAEPAKAPDLSRIASVLEDTRTDIGSAIRLALASFPPGVQKRIVLLTDGNENKGDAIREARGALAGGAVVDVVPLEYEHGREVRIEKLTAPSRSLKGEVVQVRIVVHATQPSPAWLSLRIDGRQAARKEVRLSAGKNMYTMEHAVAKGGFHTFEARVEAADDNLVQNNVGYAYTIVGGAPRALVVESDPEDARFLLQALKAHEIEGEVALPAETPATPAGFQNWDVLFLSNVEAPAFSAAQLKSIEAAVRNLGMGLVMVGGENAFGAGDYNGTPVEEALPVFAEVKQRKILPNGALVLIMHTCEFPDANVWGKRICKQAVRKLTAKDLVGLIYFDGRRSAWLFELQPAALKKKISGKIDGMEAGDMPDFDTSLQMAYQALKNAPAAVKHVVVVSDGDPSPPSGLLKRALARSAVSVSTVCIEPHPNDRNARIVMKDIARVTGGRAYFPKRPDQLPGILIHEAAQVRRKFVKEEPFQPVAVAWSEILKGLDPSNLPRLLGRVICTEKPTAAVPLRAPDGDPVLAHWRHGLGRSAAFTSDAKNRWAAAWVGWKGFEKFWGQVGLWCLRTVAKNNFRLSTSVTGHEGRIVLDALDEKGAFIDEMEVEARTATPSAKAIQVPLAHTGPGRFEGTFDVPEVGTYPIMVTFDDGRGRRGALPAGLALSYAPEFEDTVADRPFLESLAEAGGGRVRRDLEGVFEHDLPARRHVASRWPALVLAAAFLFLIDVFQRRVVLPYGKLVAGAVGALRLGGSWIAGRRRAPSSSPEGSMEALLKKKAEVAREREVEAALFEAPAEGGEVVPGGTPGAPPPPAEEPGPSREDREGEGREADGAPSFTQRLLDAKKRAWKKEQED